MSQFSKKVEKVDSQWNRSWDPGITDIINIRISDLSKELKAKAHKEKMRFINSNNNIIYTDGSKSENNNIKAGSYNLQIGKFESWNLGVTGRPTEVLSAF